MIIGTIFSITPAFVYWLAGDLAANGAPGAPTAGTIVAFTTLQSRLFFPLGQLLNIQVEIQGSLALFDRIFEYLEMEPEIVDAPDAVALDPQTIGGRVRFRGRLLPLPGGGQAARDRGRVGRRRRGRGRDRGRCRPEARRWREHRRRRRACRCRRTRRGGSIADAVLEGGGDIGAEQQGELGHPCCGASQDHPSCRPRPPDVRARGHRLRGRARPARRTRRAVGRRQDDHDLPHPAAVRRR